MITYQEKALLLAGDINTEMKKGSCLATSVNHSFGSMPSRFNSLRQAVLTHVLNGLSLLTKSICSSKSSSKRMILEVLLERSKVLLSFLSCIGLYHHDKLVVGGLYQIKVKLSKKQCPAVRSTLTGHLITNDNHTIEVTMSKHNTPVTGRNSYTLSQSAKIYANQAILSSVGGWDLNHINNIYSVQRHNLELIKKCAIHHLRLLLNVGYSDQALAKSSVRIETLNPYKAAHDAPSVFFCVHSYAHLLNAVLYRAYSMVMLAGQPKGWLVSLYASSLNPVSVTTPIEIETSSGDSLALYKEIIVMMAIPTQTQFKFLFLSVKRSDTTAKPCRITITAPNEHDARLMLVRDYILSFAGRVPVQGVTA